METEKPIAESLEVKPHQTVLGRYGAAILFTLAAFALRLVLRPVLGDENPFLLFLFAVGCSAWYGGVSAGLLATLLATFLSVYFFLPPYNLPQLASPQQAGHLALFVFECVGVSLLCRNLSVTRGRSERQQAALLESSRNLRAKQSQLRLITDALPALIAYVDRDERFRFVNQAFETWFGTSVKDLRGKHVRELIGDAAYEIARPNMTRALAGEHVVYERSMPYQRGGTRYTSGVHIPDVDENGNVRGFIVLVTDITERKRAEESAQFLAAASETLAASLDYETTVESVTRLVVPQLADWCTITLINPDNTLRTVSMAHCDATKNELIAKLRRYTPTRLPDDNDAATRGTPKVLRTGVAELVADVTDEMLVAYARDSEHLRLLRELKICSYMVVPLCSGKRTFGAVAFTTTAESGRRYDAADLAVAENFADRFAAAIDNAELLSRARAANQAKDDFLATLSHELRTPLTPIIGWLHMIRSRSLPTSEIERGLDIISRNTQSLSRLINDLLDMSAILSGKINLDKTSITLAAALREAIERIQPQASARGVHIEFSNPCVEFEHLVVKADRTRLVQIFWNLLNNAVKFSDDGGRVTLGCEVEAGACRVSVRDEGIGIAPEFLPHVFESFRQADSSSTRTYGGMGIGLSLVKKFTEEHGGTICIESGGARRGTLITVTLPVISVDDAHTDVPFRNFAAGENGDDPNKIIMTPTFAKEMKETNQKTPASFEPKQSKARILIVDDATDTLEIMNLIFRRAGYEPVICEDAFEALRYAASSEFDVVIADIGLPDMNGHELIERLRQLPHFRDVPAIALTGYAAQRDADKALAAGFTTHLAKPVTPDELLTTIEELLNAGERKQTSNETVNNANST